MVTGTAFAASGQEAHQQAAHYKQQGNYAQAYCIWNELAADGDADAQYNLGWMFHNGYGLAIDDQQALHYWLLAAEQRHGDALMSLGNLYRLGGKGVKKSTSKAIEHFLNAALAGAEDAGDLIRVMLHQAKPSRFEFRAEIIKKHSDLLGGALKVSAERSNFREKSSTKSKVIRVLKKNDRLIELGRQGVWIHAATPDDALVGWVHKSLVTAAAN